MKPTTIKIIGALLISLTALSYLVSFNSIIYFNTDVLNIFTCDNHINYTKKKTYSCKIPDMDPFDESIKRFIVKQPLLNCSDIPPLISSNETHLIIEENNLKFYNIRSRSRSVVSTGLFGKSNLPIIDEIIMLNTRRTNSFLIQEIYTDFHCFVPSVLRSRSSGSKDGLNVIIVGLDSISRLNFHRTMPLTLNYLTNELNAIEFAGYNIVGYGTYSNLISFLSGLHRDELRDTCWQNEAKYYDYCDFIWKYFNKSGYVTSFSEDATWMGLFHYEKKGFKVQPTDYYWTTYSYQAEVYIGHEKPGYATLCIGTRPVFEEMLRYLLKLINTYKGAKQKFFGFFWHDFLNFPFKGDEIYMNYLQKIKYSKVLENSILVVVSDHGMRWGSILSTHQGHVESKLPMLYIVLPTWFESKYPLAVKNLKENSFGLTTPFDVYETLKDIADNNFEGICSEDSSRRTSLFRSIPSNRTCNSAGIPENWCSCENDHPINSSDVTVKKAVHFIVKFINKNLENYTDCATLTLSNIADTRYFQLFNFPNKYQNTTYYNVNFRTYPGDAAFEATVRCVKCDNDFRLSGSVGRTNLYANQSYCVSSTGIKLYCYCLKQ